MDRRHFMLSSGVLLALGSTPLWAQPRRDIPPEYAIFDSPVQTHVLRRSLVDVDEERRYQIFTAIPSRKASPQGYPVLYMLDGNAVFDRLTPEILAGIPDLAIVGIGYQTNVVFDSSARSRDYTPALPEGYQMDERRRSRPSGGAEQFLKILQETIRPRVEAGFPANTAQCAIWGHSYGGLFCLYTLLTAPDAFARYIPVSPSSGWGDGVLQNLAEKAPVRDTQKYGMADVLVMLGDSEARRNSTEPPPQRPSPTTMQLVETLRQRADLHVEAHVFEGLGHGATFSASFSRAFSWAGAEMVEHG